MLLIKENVQPLADELMSYCQKQLGYQSSPSLHFQEDEENSKNPLGKTAHYSPDENKVVIYTTGRHIKDILRSMAHELVHHLQNTRGEFDTPHETGPGYAQKDGHMRNMEKEAYLLGNLLFRDWEDQKKLQESKQMKRSKLEEMVRKVLMEKLQNESEISEVSDEVKARTAPKDKANKSDFLPKKVRDKINNEEGEDSEEVEEGKGYGITTSPKYDQSMTGRPVQGKAAARPKEKATAVGGKLPSGKKGFGGVYVDDTKDDKPGVPRKYGKGDGKGGFSSVQDVNEEGLEEGGAAIRQGNEDKDQGRERMLPDRLKEEEEVEEGSTAIMQSRLAGKKEQGVKTADLGKGPAPKATDRLKKEYEEKFADIEATSRLHETKQQKLNKRLMEWCTK